MAISFCKNIDYKYSSFSPSGNTFEEKAPFSGHSAWKSTAPLAIERDF